MSKESYNKDNSDTISDLINVLSLMEDATKNYIASFQEIKDVDAYMLDIFGIDSEQKKFLDKVDKSISNYYNQANGAFNIDVLKSMREEFKAINGFLTVGKSYPEEIKEIKDQYQEKMGKALQDMENLAILIGKFDLAKSNLQLPPDDPLFKMLDDQNIPKQDVIVYLTNRNFQQQPKHNLVVNHQRNEKDDALLLDSLKEETRDMSDSHPLKKKFEDEKLDIQKVKDYFKSQEYLDDYKSHISSKTNILISNRNAINESFKSLCNEIGDSKVTEDLLNTLEKYKNNPLSQTAKEELDEKIKTQDLDEKTLNKIIDLSTQIDEYAKATFELIQDVSVAPEKKSAALIEELSKAVNFIYDESDKDLLDRSTKRDTSVKSTILPQIEASSLRPTNTPYVVPSVSNYRG